MPQGSHKATSPRQTILAAKTNKLHTVYKYKKLVDVICLYICGKGSVFFQKLSVNP